jgi:hypothetical protein
MTRRIYTYDAASGWGPLNLLATLGALTIAASVIVFVVNVVRSLLVGERAGDNPWEGTTLEWATSSPPPPYGFVRPLVVESRQPLRPEYLPLTTVVGLPIEIRSLLVTRMHDAAPDHVAPDPAPTIWPFLAAIATTVLFIGSIFTPWALVWGAIPVTVTLIGWFWPKGKEHAAEAKVEVKPSPEQDAVLRPVEAQS